MCLFLFMMKNQLAATLAGGIVKFTSVCHNNESSLHHQVVTCTFSTSPRGDSSSPLMLYLSAIFLSWFKISFSFLFSDEKVKLKDVQVLTLQHGRMTTGRRSSPVPQLSCVGGSAGCHGFKPKSVQVNCCSLLSWWWIGKQVNILIFSRSIYLLE